jgi:2-succinyl-5-enolpyruvyl-6-hydroxy-3-cyclohexene-1-carboxylate synthase
MAFVDNGRFRIRVHPDERSAAFFALGVGKASGTPAAMVTTSGTAAANVFPAVIEARQSETPLLVLTADRPHHLRGADANQAIDQLRLYGPYAKDFVEVALPALGDPELRHLRALAARVLASAVEAPAGPVHLNFPFNKPLEPSEDSSSFSEDHPLAAGGRPDGSPFVRVTSGARSPEESTLAWLAGALDSERGVVIAGPAGAASSVGPAAVRLAERTGFPLLADPLSGARYGPGGGAHRVAAYDLFLRDVNIRAVLEPSVILRVGAAPTSAALQSWALQHSGTPHIVIDGGGRWKDHGATATDYVHADARTTLDALADQVRPTASQEWRDTWQRTEQTALEAVNSFLGRSDEGDALALVASDAPAGAHLFVSSSMPVRDLDAFGHPREEPLNVWGNRGASGIDGIVSTAFGVAATSDAPTICVLGDLALLHDQNGLLWSRESDASVVFVLIDNDGGGIFHMLPIAEHEPHFSRYFAAPHGLDFRHAAELHGIELQDTTVSELGAALTRELERDRTGILRVRTERVESHLRRQ